MLGGATGADGFLAAGSAAVFVAASVLAASAGFLGALALGGLWVFTALSADLSSDTGLVAADSALTASAGFASADLGGRGLRGGFCSLSGAEFGLDSVVGAFADSVPAAFSVVLRRRLPPRRPRRELRFGAPSADSSARCPF